MILRKPYAFLIKHFRLIHLVITFLLGYITVKNRSVYVFLKECISGEGNRYDALSFINYKIYIYILIVIILFFVVHWLLKYKDKPRNIYKISIGGYIVVGIIMFIVYGYLMSFINNVPDQKTIRLYRDILSITMYFQYYIVIVMFIRGLGFDIKKFNFAKDVQELNATSEDGEEIEVSLGVDTTNVMREIRKQKREFGYFFQEFKIYIIGIILLLLLFLGYKGYNYFNDKLKIYNQNDWVGEVNYIRVTNSYFNIDNGKNYVVVKFDIYKYGKKDNLNTGNMVLVIGDEKFTPNKNICYNFNRLGNCYKKQYINEEINSYILTYDTDLLLLDDSYILYSESYDKQYKIKLNLENY